MRKYVLIMTINPLPMLVATYVKLRCKEHRSLLSARVRAGGGGGGGVSCGNRSHQESRSAAKCIKLQVTEDLSRVCLS